MNAKMKVLALALLGLAGYAGSAAASCPSSPVPPWTANSPFQGTTTIVAGGLDGSACRLDASINAGATGFASALVQDDTPTAEPRYRAQFMIDTSALSGTPGFTDAVTVFQAISATTGNGISLAIFGDGTQWLLSYTIVDANDASGYFSNSTPLPNSAVHVEFDLPVSGAADFKLFVEQNNEATPTLEHNPTNNSAITGIDTALLGLTGPSDSANGFVTHFNSQVVKFDRFDSRRSTFIGF